MQVIYKVWAKYAHHDDKVIHKSTYKHEAVQYCDEYVGIALVLWIVKTWEHKTNVSLANAQAQGRNDRRPGKVLNYAS